MQRRLFLWGLVMSWVAGGPGMASALTLDADSCRPSCQFQITRMHKLTWNGAGYPGGQRVEFLGHTGSSNWLESWLTVTMKTADSTAPIFPGVLDQSGMGFSPGLDNLGENERPWPIPGGGFWLLASGLLGVAGLSQKFIARLCISLSHLSGVVFCFAKNFISGNRFNGVKAKSP
jgi:hypothetical protein